MRDERQYRRILSRLRKEEVIEMKISKRLLVVLGILIALFNVAAFAVPFSKNAVFWLSDFFVAFSLLALLYVNQVAFKGNLTAKSRFYGFPILKVGLLYVLIIFILAICFIVISCLSGFDMLWIVLAVYVIVTGLAAIGLIAADSARNYVEIEENRGAADTTFMRKLRQTVAALEGLAEKEELKTAIRKLADDIRYSDPVSSETTFAVEEALRKGVEALQTDIRSHREDEALAGCRRLSASLRERNLICKANK